MINRIQHITVYQELIPGRFVVHKTIYTRVAGVNSADTGEGLRRANMHVIGMACECIDLYLFSDGGFIDSYFDKFWIQ